MNNINTPPERSNIFYYLDELVLSDERLESEYVDTDILFGEHTEIEMDFLTRESKVDLYKKLMDFLTLDAKIDFIRVKTFDEGVTSPSYEELLDFVSFDSKKDFPKKSQTPPKRYGVIKYENEPTQGFLVRLDLIEKILFLQSLTKEFKSLTEHLTEEPPFCTEAVTDCTEAVTEFLNEILNPTFNDLLVKMGLANMEKIVDPTFDAVAAQKKLGSLIKKANKLVFVKFW